MAQEENKNTQQHNNEEEINRHRDDKEFKKVMIKIADENDDIFKGLVDK